MKLMELLHTGLEIDNRWQLMARRVSRDGKRIAGVVFHPDPTSTDPDALIEEGWVAGIP